MKVQLAAGRKVALWVWVCSSIYVSAGQAPATKPISGRPGIVVSRRVVNFSELAQREASLRARPAVPKVQPPEREAPRPKGLPAGAIVKLAPESSSAHPNASAAVITASPLSLLANNFPAEADNNTVIPPDTQGTVGPNHLMVALNSNIVVQDRAGNRLTTVSLDAFWAPTGNSRTT